MTRTRKVASYFIPRSARRRRGSDAASPESRPPRRLFAPEALEERTLPAVTFLPDGPGKSIVRFTEDVPGTADTLQLRVGSGGKLEHNFNGAGFSADLDSATPGVQSLALSAISRIDVLLGGGNDLLSVDGLSGPSVIPTPGGIVYTAGAGSDHLSVAHDQNLTLAASALTAGGRTITSTDLETADLLGGNSSSVIDTSAFGRPVTLDGGNSDDTLIGGEANDELRGQAGSDRLEGRGGNDRLFSSNSGTTMLGGAGDDSLFGGNAKDDMFGEAGNDYLDAGNGGDNLNGGDGDDIILPGNGNDTVDGGAGTDRVVGTANVSWTLTDSSLTGEGTDSLLSIEQAYLTGAGGNNTLNAAGFSGRVSLQGGGGTDALIGGTGQNIFLRPIGETGNVTMTGGPAGSTNEYRLWPQGSLSLISTGGFDSISFLSAGSAITFDLSITDGTPQTVDASGSTVALTGLFEDLSGSTFNDNLSAASDSTVSGGAGEDHVNVNGKSNGSVNVGADAYTLQQSGGNNIVMNGDDGVDNLISTDGVGIDMKGGTGSDSLSELRGRDVTMTGGADADTLTSTEGVQIVMNGDDGVDNLISTDGVGIDMKGGTGSDCLSELRCRDVTMTGGADADTLTSTDGVYVVMNGDDGVDNLISTDGVGIDMKGGTGSDTLVGLRGRDVTMTGEVGGETLRRREEVQMVMQGDDGEDNWSSTDGERSDRTGST